MKFRFGPMAVLALAATVAACADSAPETAESNTTAQLLAQPVGDGMSTPIQGGAAANQELPPVSVTELGFNRGDPEAIVKVVELSDFGCGYCRRFHDETFPTIRDEFIQTGMVEWKFIPYVTGMFDNSLAATEAGECVMEQSPVAYEEITHRLWTDQGEWKGSGSPESLLRGWVEELDVDMGEFDGCLAEDRRVPRIAQSTTLARQVGVRGTPTFVIVGYGPLQGALETEFFQEILTAVHAEETRQREEGGDTGN